MTRAVQLRSWYRRATSVERATTVGAIATLVAVFVASIALSPPRDRLLATNAGPDGASGSVASDDPGAGGAGGNTAGSGGQASSGHGGGSASGGTASSLGGPGVPNTGGAIRTASDRGVSATQLKLGFMLQNPAGLNGAGFSTGQRTDGEKYIQAMADWANRHGGVAGRQLVTAFRFTDPTSVEDQNAACRALVDDAKVFGVVDVASVLDTAALDCIVNREKGDTPMAHSVMWSRDWQARSGGNEISYQAAIDRISITWARDLAALSWFPKGATLGILGDKCPATEPTIVNVLGRALKARGAGKVVFGLHDCDLQSVVSQPPNITTQFRLAKVTHVLTVTNFVATQVFVSTAASQAYKPKYATSDWFLNTSDATAANFDPDQFDGAVGIASYGMMLKSSGKAPYRGWETCSQIAVDAGLPPIPPGDPSSEELLGLCDNFLLMVAGIAQTGTNPTRALWRAGVQRLGTRPSAVFGPSTFRAGKLTGSDAVHTIQWQRGCRCWKSVSGFRPAA
jgi:ABC-type branched-subunit amino acid transport system substrate-binding protein